MAYNPLPGTFSADMWAHQYDQQPNQVLCTLHQREWTDNGPDSNLFGLEPNFGCCTANFHQGWPKFTASLWMGTRDGGLVAAAYAPSEVRTQVVAGVPVTIVEDTEYPFRDTIVLTIDPKRPARFPLLVRIPGWATAAQVTVNGVAEPATRAGTFHRIDRTWKAGDRVLLRFPMTIRASRWFNESIALERGPLVFSLAIGEDWRPATGLKHPAVLPAKDWEVHPTTVWNYGLAADPAALAAIDVRERPIGPMPFSPAGAPVTLIAHGLDDGGRIGRAAAEEPGDERRAAGHADAAAIRRGQAARHGVPGVDVDTLMGRSVRVSRYAMSASARPSGSAKAT
jgi:hypothetical protein